MFAVPLGRIADIYGMKKIFTYGIIILTFACFLAAISTSAEFLIISRIIQGIGSAMIFVTGLAMITSVFPPKERGKAIGINIISSLYRTCYGAGFRGFFNTVYWLEKHLLFNSASGIDCNNTCIMEDEGKRMGRM